MVKNSEIQIAFLQFYRIFPPPSGIPQHSLFIYYGDFWIYFSCSSAHEAVLWGVGRVGKIIWRPLSNTGPARRSPAQIRKLELIHPLSSDVALSSLSEYSTSWHHLNLLLLFSSYFFGFISGFTISQRKTPLNHLSSCSLFFCYP